MRLKYLLIPLIFVSLNLSCSSQESSKDIIDIYNLMIDNTVKPLPPKPPKIGKTSGMPKKIKDSLKAIKLNIAISKRLEIFNEQSLNISNYENYQRAKEDLITNENQTLIEKSWLKTDKGHNINIINTKLIDKNKLFKKYNAIVSLSNVGFNSAKDKAISIIGVSYAPKLSGTVIIYFLEKINNIWKIKNKEVVSIS